jgi:arginine/lysine/ornithine decarboxylase
MLLKIPRYELVLLPHEAYFSPQKGEKTIHSIGRISGEIVTRYPPGVPVVIPGAIITPEIRDYLLSIGKDYINVTLH